MTKLLTVPEAAKLAKQLTGEDIPRVTIRTAARTGYIAQAQRAGRDWIFPQEAFVHWLHNRPKPGRKMMLQIQNNAQEIVSTNFWDTEYNAKGLLYCSINARCFRLLVPDAMLDQVSEMMTGETALIERHGNRVIITFDDGSDAPYRLDLSVQQFDRLPTQADSGRIDLVCALWVRNPLMVFSCPASYEQFQ